MTAIYSGLHLLVDGMCALAMFGSLLPGGDRGLSILVYNFCAFALQMPLGVALDALCGGKKGRETDFPFLFVLAGVLCTVGGAFLHPAVLGIGNALFHVGGGVGTIREDDRRSWRGRGLGVFVAPGALGIYLGTVLGRGGSWQMWAFGTGVLMALLCAGAICGRKAHRFEVSGRKAHCFGMWGRKVCFFEVSGRKAHRFDVSGGEGGTERIPESGVRGRGTEADWGAEAQPSKSSPQKTEKQAAGNTGQGIRNTAIAAVCCILVVILRSYVGMAVAFPWKTGFRAGLLAVLMVVGGKAAGGFASARYGMRMTTAVSLGLAGICYLCSTAMLPGLAALFLFNMTMPITLYWLARSMPRMPGFAFGLLTFALFLGFLPTYFGVAAAVDGPVLGCAGSVLSMLLLTAGRAAERGEIGLKGIEGYGGRKG
nr:hypothetical protein [uncultured Acetatifactor sp.]